MMPEYNIEDDVLDESDVELYQDAPDFDSPQAEGELQDDEVITLLGDDIAVAFMKAPVPRVNDWKQTLAWYKANQTTSQIGFNPDGMCLKVCRTARNIPALYPSAKLAQDATPAEFRITDVADLRRGMIGYFDDPNDSNRFGHIATMIGRVRGFAPRELGDTLWETNSVKSGELVVVRGDYFADYWGDEFKFGSRWLNGVEFDSAGGPKPSKIERFNDGGPVYNLKLLAKVGPERQKAQIVLVRIETQIKRLPDNPKLVRVRAFKDEWRDERKIDLSLLDAAVKEGRTGVVKQVRDEIKRLIATLPDE